MKAINKIIIVVTFFMITIFVNKSLAQSSAYQEYEKDSVLILKSQISNTKFNFDSYDTSSIIKESDISNEKLNGYWQSYKGLMLIGDQYLPMNLVNPLIIEIDNNKIRHNLDEKFELFTIKERTLISKKKEKMGTISKITDKVLVITLKNNIAITRYYYERKN